MFVLPKTKLCEDKESARCDFVAGMIVGGLRRNNMSTDIASRKAGMSERTLRNKLQNPTSIKLGELYKLADMVGISIILNTRIFQTKGGKIYEQHCL